MSIKDTLKKYSTDIDDVTSWIEETYEANFASYFEFVRDLYAKFESTSKPITDEDLETILTSVPLEMMAASEALNMLKSQQAIISIRIKEAKYELQKSSGESSQTAKKEEANFVMLEDEILLKAYGSLIDRVDREISFARELIMGAKKIWTARRQSEIGAQTTEAPADVQDLPAYSSSSQEYIK